MDGVHFKDKEKLAEERVREGEDGRGCNAKEEEMKTE